jgi:hypothetical protein
MGGECNIHGTNAKFSYTVLNWKKSKCSITLGRKNKRWADNIKIYINPLTPKDL